MRALTEKQQRFVAFYQQVLNGAKAARLAGYPAQSARQVSYELMRKPHVKQLIVAWREEQKKAWEARWQAHLASLPAMRFRRFK